MKKILLSVFALGATMVVTAQSGQAPASNAILVSQTRDGNVVTSRYKIPHNAGKSAEFDVHYAINKANIVSSYSDNPRQIADLRDFMAQTKDTTMHISAIHIVGYASPDGKASQNDTLAAHRAQSLYQYAVNTYHPAQKIDTSHKAYHWSDCAPVVAASSIPHKEQVLAVLKSTAHTESQKETALRKMPDVWNYLTTNILPKMRYVDIEFDYGVDEYVTRTTTVASAEPVKTEQPKSNEVIVDEEMGIIIATPNSDSDCDNKRHNRKDKKRDKAQVIGEYEAIYW